MSPPDPYSLIQRTALRVRRRRRLELVLPALPPAAALLGILLLGRLPIEITAASVIALGFLLLRVSALAVPRESAAALLDRGLGAKDHFLTLATLEDRSPSDLRAVVESGAVALASAAEPLRLPRAGRRPLMLSSALSLAGFLLLWVLPDLPSAGLGEPLEQIAAELAGSTGQGDRELAKELREVLKAIRDPRLSAEQKREKVDEARAKLEKESASQSSAGSSGGKQAQQKGDKGGEKGGGGNEKGGGAGTAGQNASQQGQAQGETKGSASNALRGQAQSELSKIAGELGGEQKQAKSQEGNKGQEKPKSSGGGIKGPENGGEKTQQDGSGGAQSGADPNKPGDQQKPGDDAQGEAKQPRDAGAQPAAQGAGNRGQGGEGGSAGQKPSPSADGKPAERYYKPGEGPGGSRVEDGRYVRIRIPEEGQARLGTEIVAKPGDAEPETPYGNAPLPSAGAPGEVAIDQPQPLEYRDALGATKKE